MTLEPKTAGCLAGAFSACMTRFGRCTHVHRTRKALASLSFLLIPNLSSGVSEEGGRSISSGNSTTWCPWQLS